MVFNRILKWISAWPDVIKFLFLIVVTIVVTYFTSTPVRLVWYLILLILYFFSSDEALWLAFFLSTTDGFSGFFGLYSVVLPILPGLPAAEAVQIYIVLSVIKAARSNNRVHIFYNKYLQILFLYLIFTIIWGQMMGLSGGLNVYFRVLKGFIPMLLFYSVPRLFVNEEVYERFFRLIFFIVLLAFAAQVFTLLTGLTPKEAIGLIPDEDTKENKDFRFFYNSGSTLLGLFAALFYLNRNKNKSQNPILPFIIVFIAMAMSILSATRGWIISFSLIILLTLIFTGTIRSRRGIEFIVIAFAIVVWALSNPIINKQIVFARERLGALGAIREGDLSAKGTLIRLDYRSKRVMDGWKENPVFGWGLSDKGYEFGDNHVGNQSLLATSGIVGFILLNGFLIYFAIKILDVYFRSAHRITGRDSLLVFIIFLAGWFIIHSSSGQQFNFIGMPERIIPESVIFSFGALQFERSLNLIHGKRV